MTNRSRILIADDHNLVAELCKRLLETEFDVVGIVGDGRALVRDAEKLRPHGAASDERRSSTGNNIRDASGDSA